MALSCFGLMIAFHIPSTPLKQKIKQKDNGVSYKLFCEETVVFLENFEVKSASLQSLVQKEICSVQVFATVFQQFHSLLSGFDHIEKILLKNMIFLNKVFL